MKVGRRRAIAILITVATITILGTTASFVVWTYLTADGRSLPIAGGLAVATVIGALVAWRVLPRLESGRASTVLCTLSILTWVAILGSILIGRVTHARFAFTTYGAIPIPALDITIDDNGVLWFRDKSHRITWEEIEPLLSGSTQLVIIGNGWSERARVEPRIFDLLGDKVEVLETGAAFEAYNRAKTEGKRVVLLAHTTC